MKKTNPPISIGMIVMGAVCIIGLTIGLIFEHNGKTQTSETPSPSVTAASASVPSPSVQPSSDSVITMDNPDLTALLATRDTAVFSSFATTYADKKIEFDGCIEYVANHDSYKTRYDIMLMGGDYVDVDTTNLGPMFEFNNVNTYDLGINDLYLPSFISAGTNVHIIAKVKNYDANLDLFFLDPVQITQR